MDALRAASVDAGGLDAKALLECVFTSQEKGEGGYADERRRRLHDRLIQLLDEETAPGIVDSFGDVETRCPGHIISIVNRCACGRDGRANTVAALLVAASAVKPRRAFDAIVDALSADGARPLRHQKDSLWNACLRLSKTDVRHFFS